MLIYVVDNTTIAPFSIESYDNQLKEFSYDDNRNVGEINTSCEAKKVALTLWRELYGKSVISRVSCKVFYDETNQMWLVKGNKYFFIPSGPYALISAKDGKILAVWDEKF